MPLVLASGSPRRQELIQLLGLPWRVMVADVDEESVGHDDPALNAILTAQLKADAVVPLTPANAVIIAADTMVVLDGRVLGKPANAAEARQMLQALRGRIHQVVTSIVVINKANGQTVTDAAVVDVPMREYSDQEIEAYIATGDPFDKAGGYAIQHPGFQPVPAFGDCFAAVVGLPLCHLTRALQKVGTFPPNDVPAACQRHHNYQCPVFEEILNP